MVGQCGELSFCHIWCPTHLPWIHVISSPIHPTWTHGIWWLNTAQWLFLLNIYICFSQFLHHNKLTYLIYAVKIPIIIYTNFNPFKCSTKLTWADSFKAKLSTKVVIVMQFSDVTSVIGKWVYNHDLLSEGFFMKRTIID